MRFKTAALILALAAFVAVPIFVSPLLATLFKMGDYGAVLVFGLVLPIVVALFFFLLVAALGWLTGLFSRS